MGRVFSVDFEYPNYYMCKTCRIHIAAPVDPDYTPQPGRTFDIFMTVINVEASNQCRSLSGIFSAHLYNVSDVHCIKCGDNMGFKCIQTVSGERVIGNDFVQLEMKKLLWRKGREIRDAETLNIIERA